MTLPTESASVDRRLLLRGGAVLAGATVLAVAAKAPEASAADGDELIIGEENEGATSTTLTSTPGSATATLVLANEAGPTLRLTPIEDEFEDGELASGDIVGTDLGPLVGVDYGDGPEVDILATGADLDAMATPIAVSPERLLDTRTVRGRASIVQRSTGALTAAGKLRGGEWIDVAIAPADDGFDLSAVFVNLTAVSPEGNGFAVVYPPGDRPGTSTLNFRPGFNVANAAFVAPGTYQGDFVVRVYSAQTAHVLLDLSGAVVAASIPAEVSSASASTSGSRRAQRQAKQLNRIKKSLARS